MGDSSKKVYELQDLVMIIILTVHIDYDLAIIPMWMTADPQTHKVWNVDGFLVTDPTKQNLKCFLKFLFCVRHRAVCPTQPLGHLSK